MLGIRKKDGSLASINQGPGVERAGIRGLRWLGRHTPPILVRLTNRKRGFIPRIAVC